MDPISFNEDAKLSVEFGHCPRTPNPGRYPADTPNDTQGSPVVTSSRKRDRFLDALRFRARRDTAEAKTKFIPKSLARRKSVVDLFQFPSIRSRGQIEPEAIINAPTRRLRSVSPKKGSADTDETVVPDIYQPRRRKSLGDIVGSLSMRVRHMKWPQNSEEAVPTQLHYGAEYSEPEHTVPTHFEADYNSSGHHFTEPADTAETNDGAFDEDLEELTDRFSEMVAERLRAAAESPTPSTHSWSSGEVTLGSRRGIYCPSDDGVEEFRSQTPDSYLQLLIEATSPSWKDSTPNESRNEVSLSPLPCKFQASEPVDFLGEGSWNDELGESSKLIPHPTGGFEPLETGILTAPEGFSFETPQFHEKVPVITVQEVVPSYELPELDQGFQLRVEDRATRYARLIANVNNATSAKERADDIYEHRIKMTVAKMTLNYRFVSTSEDCWPEFPAKDLKRVLFDLSPGEAFEEDQAEVLASIIHGNEVLHQYLPYDGPKTVPSLDNLRHRVSTDATLEATVDIRTPLESATSQQGQQPAYETEAIQCSTPESLPMPIGELYPAMYEFQFDGHRQPAIDIPVERRAISKRQEVLGDRSSKAEKVNPIQGEITIQFPGTVNLYSHTETFDSMERAFSALFDYKLGDLSNFCTYNPKEKLIFAHSLDEPVPSPVELNKKGLQLIWLPMLQIVPPNHSRAKFGEIDSNIINSEFFSSSDNQTTSLDTDENAGVDATPNSEDSLLLERSVRGEDEISYETDSEHENSVDSDESFSQAINRAMTRLLENQHLNFWSHQNGDGTGDQLDRQRAGIRYSDENHHESSERPLEAHPSRIWPGLERRYRAMHSRESMYESSVGETLDYKYSEVNVKTFEAENSDCSAISAGPNVPESIATRLTENYLLNGSSLLEDDISDEEPLELRDSTRTIPNRESELLNNDGINAPACKVAQDTSLTVVPSVKPEEQCEVAADAATTTANIHSPGNLPPRSPSLDSTMSVRPGFRVVHRKRKPFKSPSRRKHRGRSYSIDSIGLSSAGLGVLVFTGGRQEDERPQQPMVARQSSQGFRSGFNFTAYANQFATMANAEDAGDGNTNTLDEKVSKPKSLLRVPLSLPPLPRISRSLRERSRSPKREFEILDMERHNDGMGMESSKLTTDLEQSLSPQPSIPFKAPDTEDLNLCFIGPAARSRTSPKVGALVEIFQARGLMPQSLKPGLHRAQSSASLNKTKEPSRQPSEEPTSQIWSAFVE